MWSKTYKGFVICLLAVILLINIVLIRELKDLNNLMKSIENTDDICIDCIKYQKEIEDLKISFEENDLSSFERDTIFVGNSLIEGLRLHSGSESVFLSKGGINIDGLKSYIYNSLRYYDCKRVIIGLGTNEMGIFNKEQFIQSYQDLIVHIREINPNCEIIILSIPPVTRNRSAEGDRYNNANVKIYNSYLVELCELDSELVFIDCQPFFTDALNTEWSGDGLHLYDNIYKLWYDYILGELGFDIEK